MSLLLNNIKKTLSFKELVLDIFYPKSCIVCNSFVNIGKKVSLCPDCSNRLNKHVKVIRDTDKYFEEAICALEYSGNVKSAMADYKFRGIRYLSAAFGYAVGKALANREFINDISVICPVPLHPLRDREYNQSELIASHIAKEYSINHIPDLLIKIRNLSPLSRMGYKMRVNSIKSAIAFNSCYNIVGKNICLVDDIYTTGTTVNECARILKMYGASKVYVATACYTELGKDTSDETATIVKEN